MFPVSKGPCLSGPGLQGFRVIGAGGNLNFPIEVHLGPDVGVS